MEYGPILKELFQTNYFRIVVIEDETTVEVCGALKVGMGINLILNKLVITNTRLQCTILRDRFQSIFKIAPNMYNYTASE